MRRERGPYRYRRMQMLEGMNMDAYRPGRKPHEPMHCGRCGAVFHKGRWTWRAAPPGTTKSRCPACLRIAERSPAGFITLSGGFFQAHRDEVLALIRHCETKESADHPLERIMATEGSANETQVTTTSVHLARRIAHALERAFKGDLSLRYNKLDNLLRVRWNRALA